MKCLTNISREIISIDLEKGAMRDNQGVLCKRGNCNENEMMGAEIKTMLFLWLVLVQRGKAAITSTVD